MNGVKAKQNWRKTEHKERKTNQKQTEGKQIDYKQTEREVEAEIKERKISDLHSSNRRQ
jgi:hypothetical protein